MERNRSGDKNIMIRCERPLNEASSARTGNSQCVPMRDPSEKCPICSGSEVTRTFTVTREDRYRILHGPNAPPACYSECATCGAMNFIGADRTALAYGEGTYYGIEGDAGRFLEQRFHEILSLPPERSDNAARVKRIRMFFSEHASLGVPRTVLDIGAGTGVFLAAFLDEHWRGIAVEPEPNASAHLRKCLRKISPTISVVEGFSSSIPNEEQCGLITLNRVLEHIGTPRELLQTELGHLAARGVLYIEVPDTLSFYLDGPNNEAFGYTHLTIYSPFALLLVTRAAGFEPLLINRVQEPSAKFTLYGFFRKALQTQMGTPREERQE